MDKVHDFYWPWKQEDIKARKGSTEELQSGKFMFVFLNSENP